MTVVPADPLPKMYPSGCCGLTVGRTPKTARGKRFLEDREPQVHENVKTAVFMRGTRTSAVVNEAFADLVRTSAHASVDFSFSMR